MPQKTPRNSIIATEEHLFLQNKRHSHIWHAIEISKEDKQIKAKKEKEKKDMHYES